MGTEWYSKFAENAASNRVSRASVQIVQTDAQYRTVQCHAAVDVNTSIAGNVRQRGVQL